MHPSTEAGLALVLGYVLLVAAVSSVFLAIQGRITTNTFSAIVLFAAVMVLLAVVWL